MSETRKTTGAHLRDGSKNVAVAIFVFFVLSAFLWPICVVIGHSQDPGKARTNEARKLTLLSDHYRGDGRYPSADRVVVFLQSHGVPAVVGTLQASTSESVASGTVVVNSTPRALRFYEWYDGLISVVARDGGAVKATFNHGSTWGHYWRKCGFSSLVVFAIFAILSLLFGGCATYEAIAADRKR